MTDKYDFFMAMPVASGKVYGCLKKIFLDKFFAREKNSDDERFTRSENSTRNENFAARKISPQRKLRRNENFAARKTRRNEDSANNIIDNKNLPTTKRASSEAL